MATLTIGLSGSATVNGSKNYTLTDAQVARLIAAMKYYFGSTLTDGQALVAWADGVIDHTKSQIAQAERNQQTVPTVEIS